MWWNFTVESLQMHRKVTVAARVRYTQQKHRKREEGTGKQVLMG